MNGVHILGTGTTEERLKDLESAMSAFVLINLIAQGAEQASQDEMDAVQRQFTDVMTRIQRRVVANI